MWFNLLITQLPASRIYSLVNINVILISFKVKLIAEDYQGGEA